MNNSGCKITPIVGNSDFTKNISNLIQTVSQSSASILLVGERGTGKRLLAQHIHCHYCTEKSELNSISYNKKDFYEVNCKSFSKNDIEMIFKGVVQYVPSGKKVTLYISFVNELTIELQQLLIKVVKYARQNGILLKLICGTELNLEDSVSSGQFISELYYMINNVVLNMLPLRLRREDILPIAEYYREQFKNQSGLKFTEFSADAKDEMQNQYWKGNIDELINAVQKGFLVGSEPVINVQNLGILSNCKSLVGDVSGINNSIDTVDKSLKTAIDTFKKEYITRILEENGWNQTKTAKILGIQRTYVIKLINELDIRK